MKVTRKIILINIGLVVAATAIILLLLPRVDRQSYNYELNQPWRYQLLTADFDMPIMRDSASARLMRDSIDRSFVPFVRRNPNVASDNLEKFRNAIHDKVAPGKLSQLTNLIEQAYGRGIVSTELFSKINSSSKQTLRVADIEDGGNAVQTIDASEMLSPPKAFAFIDSVYHARLAGSAATEVLDPEIAHAIGTVLTPNIVLDTAADNKYREQEYLMVNGATGVIKKGQRIVDRGEIVTPQIFTNLNTYLELAEQHHETDNDTTYFMAGQALYILLCFSALYAFLYTVRLRFFCSTRNMIFLVTFITAFVVFGILMFEYLANGIFFVPFTAIPVIIIVFFDSRTAIFSLIVAVMISTLVAVYPFNFIFLELAAGLTAAFSINTLERRSQLLRTALFSFFAYVVAYGVMILVTEGSLASVHWHIIGAFAINSVVLSFAYFIIYIVERVTGLTSSVTLVELSDINNPLLRRLAEEAPGTFQHSMQVSTLAADAARAIGANTQLTRTGALYHDVGKLDGPIFFTENQHGVNPHTGLNPEVSAHKIISHVNSGLTLAQKAKLPEVIRDFITQHHGRSLAKYFYTTAVNESPHGQVDRSKFTYPGPNPQSRETAILMMADSVEAASRSLPEYTPEAISDLVDRIIDTQEKDGLFNESPISFRDIETIKKTFKKRLSTIYHSRVAYPTLKKQPQDLAQKPAEPEKDADNKDSDSTPAS